MHKPKPWPCQNSSRHASRFTPFPARQKCRNVTPNWHSPHQAPYPYLYPVPEKSTPQREYALQADALFEFGKAVLKAEGFNAIEVMIQQVQKEYSSIDKIRVIGYTDPIGPVALNKKLSTQRANTVADRLYKRGLRPKSGIEAEGRWSLELAKVGCKNTPTPENKMCHAPNRRVVIVIFGARR